MRGAAIQVASSSRAAVLSTAPPLPIALSGPIAAVDDVPSGSRPPGLACQTPPSHRLPAPSKNACIKI